MYDDESDYLTVEQCAQRLNIPTSRVIELVQNRVLKSYHDGVLWVQPAIITGAVEVR